MDILLKGAVWMLFAALVLAWVGTFSKLIVVRPVQALIKDHEALFSRFSAWPSMQFGARCRTRHAGWS